MCNLGSVYYKLLNISFPFFFSLLMIPCGLIRYNFTGLLNEPIICCFAYLVCALGGFLLFIKLRSLLKKTICKKACIYMTALFSCMLLTVILPYHNNGDLLSQLHLLTGLLAFLFLHRILFEFRYFNRKITGFYLGCLLLSFLFVITYQSITGLSEYIFVIGLWISLYHS